jgi:uncharacterized protein YkwD
MKLFNFILALLIGISVEAQPTPTSVVGEINKFRLTQGVKAAKMDPAQNRAAQAQADWIATTGLFQHNQNQAANGLPLLAQPWDRGNYFKATVVAENFYGVAKSSTAAYVVKGWTESPGHRKNMLYQVGDLPELECRVGVGVAVLKSDPTKIIVVMVIGDNVDRATGQIRH